MSSSGHTERISKNNNAMEETEKKSPSTMDCLPLELQQEILTQLSLQDLARLRCTAKSQQTVVNNSSKHLSKQLCLPELARLQDYTRYHFDCNNSQIDLLEALRRFFAHRRYGTPYPGPVGLATDFVEHWIDQHHGVSARSVTMHFESSIHDHPVNAKEATHKSKLAFSIRALERLVGLMMRIHTQYHTGPSLWGLWPYGSRSHDSLVDSTVSKYLELPTDAYGIDEVTLRSWETDIVNHGLANLPRDARQQDFLRGPGYDIDGIPRFVLTPLNVRWIVKRRPWPGSMRPHGKAERVQRIDGICSASRLVETLGLPPLAENGLFAYGVQSECAFKQVQKAIESGQEIDGLAKAMVLKETFVF